MEFLKPSLEPQFKVSIKIFLFSRGLNSFHVVYDKIYKDAYQFFLFFIFYKIIFSLLQELFIFVMLFIKIVMLILN